MILRGLTAAAPVPGYTQAVLDPIDQGAPVGWGVVGGGGYWMANPSPNFAFSALGTPTAGAAINIDWSAAGYFTVTMPASGTSTFQFATTATAALAAAAQVPSFDLGQMIVIQVTGAAATAAWPSTGMTWVGAGSATDGVHTAPVLTSLTTIIWLVCTGTGSSPTFTGFYITG